MQRQSQYTVFLRVHNRSLTLVTSRQIPLRHNRLPHQSRHFSSSCQKFGVASSNQESWMNLMKPVRPSGIWLVPHGASFNEQQLMNELPKIEASTADLPVTLFLVTPKLAHLFGDENDFQSRVINRLYSGSKSLTPRQSVVAVVDALPVIGKAQRGTPPEIDGGEGVAISVLPRVDTQRANLDDKELGIISLTGDEKEPTRKQPDNEHKKSISFNGRVANTTFVNGRQSTMYIQNWQLQDGQKWVPNSEPLYLRCIDIPLYNTMIDRRWPAQLNVQLIKLTKPKVILSSMGNIIRLLQTADGKELAASHELEQLVPTLLKERQQDLSTVEVRVFALVYPPALAEGHSFEDLVWKANRNGRNRDKLLSLIINGARLYRVTSGGAGWGQKAGLLSLEPLTELNDPTDGSRDSPSFIFDDNEDIRMPGSADLFPPGYVVQFVATCHDAEGLTKSTVSLDKLRTILRQDKFSAEGWLDPYQTQQFCVGTVVLPETHQHTSMEMFKGEASNGDNSDTESPPTQIFCPERFGFLTSSAMSVSSTDPSSEHAKHSSLIELPNSFFLARFTGGGLITTASAAYNAEFKHSKAAQAAKDEASETGTATTTAKLAEAVDDVVHETSVEFVEPFFNRDGAKPVKAKETKHMRKLGRVRTLNNVPPTTPEPRLGRVKSTTSWRATRSEHDSLVASKNSTNSSSVPSSLESESQHTAGLDVQNVHGPESEGRVPTNKVSIGTSFKIRRAMVRKGKEPDGPRIRLHNSAFPGVQNPTRARKRYPYQTIKWKSLKKVLKQSTDISTKPNIPSPPLTQTQNKRSKPKTFSDRRKAFRRVGTEFSFRKISQRVQIRLHDDRRVLPTRNVVRPPIYDFKLIPPPPEFPQADPYRNLASPNLSSSGSPSVFSLFHSTKQGEEGIDIIQSLTRELSSDDASDRRPGDQTEQHGDSVSTDAESERSKVDTQNVSDGSLFAPFSER